MAVVVIGGHARNRGKTTLATQILRAFAPLGWTAIKISGHLHGSAEAAVEEELDFSAQTDSGRMLAAGAGRSLWIRAQPGAVSVVLADVLRESAAAPNTLIESNSILDVLEPDLYLVVVDHSWSDVKASAVRHRHRADALFLREHGVLDGGDVAAEHGAAGKPVFPLHAAALDPGAVRWLTTALHDSSFIRNPGTPSALR